MASSEWYLHATFPSTNAQLKSAPMRSELDAITSGISAKLPDLSGNGGKVVVVKADESGLEAAAAVSYPTIEQVQNSSFVWCGTAGGTANAITLTPTPAITAYAAGQSFVFKAGASSSTSTITFAISGLTTIAGQVNFAACTNGDIVAGKLYQITLDTTSTAQIVQLGDVSGQYSPVLSFGGGSTGLTYAGRLGFWSKIDNRMFVDILITLSAKGSSTGAARITLPFPPSLSATNPAVSIMPAQSLTFANMLCGFVSSANYLELRNYASGGTVAALTDAAFGNDTSFTVSVSYML
jgi:hypothetical protein